MMIVAVNLFAVLIQIEVVEDDLLILLDGIFQISYIIVNGFITVLAGIEAYHIAFQNVCFMGAAQISNFIN